MTYFCMIPNICTPEDAATYLNFKDSDNNDARCVTIDIEDGGSWRRTECGRRKVSGGESIGVLCQRLPSKE